MPGSAYELISQNRLANIPTANVNTAGSADQEWDPLRTSYRRALDLMTSSGQGLYLIVGGLFC